MTFMTFSHRRWFCRWVFKGVQAWAGPVVPLKALANQMVGKPHSAYFSMYLPRVKREREDRPCSTPALGCRLLRAEEVPRSPPF